MRGQRLGETEVSYVAHEASGEPRIFNEWTILSNIWILDFIRNTVFHVILKFFFFKHLQLSGFFIVSRCYTSSKLFITVNNNERWKLWNLSLHKGKTVN